MRSIVLQLERVLNVSHPVGASLATPTTIQEEWRVGAMVNPQDERAGIAALYLPGSRGEDGPRLFSRPSVLLVI
jgi:hypothetical protein